MKNVQKLAFAASTLVLTLGYAGNAQAGMMTYSERIHSEAARTGVKIDELTGMIAKDDDKTEYTVVAETTFGEGKNSSYTLVYNAPDVNFKKGTTPTPTAEVLDTYMKAGAGSGFFGAISEFASNTFSFRPVSAPTLTSVSQDRSAVPEPSTIALFALGLAGVFGLRRHMSKKKAG